MLFSSLTFLVWFLPVVILVHLALPMRYRNGFLLAASIFFYAWGEIRYVPLILLSMAANYGLGLLIDRTEGTARKLWLVCSILLNIGLLLYYKYAGFLLGALGLSALAPQLVMPLGISFFTFQIQGYQVDVYRRKVEAERNPVDLATFILLFPQLIAGPIVLYTDIRQELHGRRLERAGLDKGMTQLVLGLSAKVLLANPLGALAQSVITRPSASALAMVLATTAGMLQLYFDFSGYSLMAIGMGNMLGFRFPKNFDYPLATRTVSSFWRHWHMTLGHWFREYVYIPLGGSRRGGARTVANLFVVWALSGLWHGADLNHLLWGLWFFVFIALERTRFGGLIKGRPWLGLCYTQLVFWLAWPLFEFDKLKDSLSYYARLFGGGLSGDVLYLLRGQGLLLALALLACSPAVARHMTKLGQRYPALKLLALMALLLASLAALTNSAYNPFIYFRF